MIYVWALYSFYDVYVSLLKAAIAAAVSLSLLISLDRLYRVAKYLRISGRAWLTGHKPEQAYASRPLPDPTHFSLAYPKVAVQLPMFNERAVCQSAIDSAAELVWPRNRFCVQVWLCPGDQVFVAETLSACPWTAPHHPEVMQVSPGLGVAEKRTIGPADSK